MEFVYIALAVMVIAIVYEAFIRPYRELKKIIELLESFEERGYILTIEKHALYDFGLENNKLLILIKVVTIPPHSTVTINSKDTWSLTWGGNPAHPGRAYPKQRYLNELVPFLKKDFAMDKPTLKLVLLYPSTEKILRYLNESELDFITPEKLAYGYKVTTAARFVNDFFTLIGEGKNE